MSEEAAPATAAADETELTIGWWRAANYLTVAQIYLQENPLLREPLRPEHIKPRLLGHWGTSPGAQPRLRAAQPADPRDRPGRPLRRRPGARRPGRRRQRLPRGHLLGDLPARSPRDEAGLRRLVRQFSTPGGIPSHVSVPTPGSIHEGGELGYALVHAFGAAFDNPDLLVACVIGDGEAETGAAGGLLEGRPLPQPGPRRRGAADPAPEREQDLRADRARTRGRGGDREPARAATATRPAFVERRRPARGPPRLRRARSTECRTSGSRAIQARPRGERLRRPARAGRRSCCARRRAGPGRSEVDGVPVEGTFRAHQVPLGGVRENPEHLAMLEDWMRSYRPEERFDDDGRLVAELAALAPNGDKRMGATPHANGGRAAAPLEIPDSSAYAVPVEGPGTGSRAESTRPPRRAAARPLLRQPRCELPPLLPRRDQLQPARRRLRGRGPLPDGRPARRRARLSRRPGDGGPLRAQLPGLARGLPAERPPRPLRHLRGVRDGLRLDGDPAHQVAGGDATSSSGARRSPRSTSCSPRPAGATTTTASATRARA